jgi:hypothetical protein
VSGPRRPDARLAALTRDQFGLVTRAQALAAGLTYHQVRHRLDIGTLVRVARELYRLAGAPETWDQRALAAVLAIGEGAVLCGRSAATVWKLSLPKLEEIEVLAPRSRSGQAGPGAALAHRVRTVRPQDKTYVGVSPVTTIQRTLVDLAGTLNIEALDRVVDEAISRKLTTPDRLAKTVSAVGGRGRKGIRNLRQVLGPWLEHPQMDSVAEAAWLRALGRAGLPAPVTQYGIVRADGKRAIADFAWPEARLVLEVDGYRWHAGPRSHSRDLERATSLEAAGWRVLRTTPTELVTSPSNVTAAIARHVKPTPAGDARPDAGAGCSTVKPAGTQPWAASSSGRAGDF